MIRLLHIDDPQLRERVRQKIAETRDMAAAHIPDWWEMDDADFSAILIELRYEDEHGPASSELSGDEPGDPRSR